MLTCVPPRSVQMPLTNDTCENCPSDADTHTSQRSLIFSWIFTASGLSLRYRSTYELKSLMGTRLSFKNTWF